MNEKTKVKPVIRIVTGIILSIIGITIIISVTGLTLAYRYLNDFSRSSGLSKQDIINTAREGIKNPYNNDYVTFLILGIDRRPSEETMLTDTMIMVVVNSKTGDYLLLSLPRDLWIESLKTKINALYYYGKKADPNDGSDLVRKKVEEIFDWKIDYTAVVTMDSVKELVDLLGGVKIEVERAFTDDEFPKDDGSFEVKTISFEKGSQTLDGEMALQFIRSRKSKDLVEGTDEARQIRQKKVIMAIKEKFLSDTNTWRNPGNIGLIYSFLVNQIEIKPTLGIREIFSFWKIGASAIRFGKEREVEIPWQGENSILVEGRDPIYRSWILMPRDNNSQILKDFFHKNLP